MKTTSLLLAASASLAMFISPALAAPAAPAAAAPSATKPYPIKVVNPTELPRSFSKSTVTLALKLDANGVPSEIQPISRVDKKVAARLVEAVSQWRFAPITVNGKPVAGPAVLPLEITPTA